MGAEGEKIAVLESRQDESDRRMAGVEKICQENSEHITSLVMLVGILSKVVFGGCGVILLAVVGAAIKMVVKGN